MQRTSRKKEHIELAYQTGLSGRHGFEDVKFVHNCIPESAFSLTSLNTVIGGLSFSSPIIINAMTGGAHETAEVNRKLAIFARECGLAMAVGSQMAAIKDPRTIESYTVARQLNPNGILMANLGAEATVAQALQAVEMIEADMLQIHLNVMQELIMPEGDRDFRGVLERIEAIVEAAPCPVMIKEVGFGIDFKAAEKLATLGIAALDIGGSGGTNFAKIENERRVDRLDMFHDWGLNTTQSLLEVAPLREGVDIIATGGISNGLEIAKALSIGAKGVGMAGYFLKLALQATEKEALLAIEQLHHQLRIVMTALGVDRLEQMGAQPVVISGDTYHWATMRGIDCAAYSQRS
ncbi:type 2 isopentenyl-diphosphate Delta-isomerase [Ammoniphilus oxalaticus]|uniref:Isopentenyl-diphosphate delta-isomerase n=1 Tax=Ammoniphilus oxalaticus TaxID=66863 RepID=A0A419SN29_9BACL|nr:type 2 isopentenyl-diphosphate Delta-isomerase [Ammoniphilus oxalaticus]RKD25685.1 type 2 isopentenyl-diphosphate Delta-isomerase [Ammoniphilus oxalaticus]